MTTTLIEESETGTLKFEFENKWQVYKYDEQISNNFYNRIKGSSGLKAVDFIAISDKSILLIEAKYITATDKKSRMRLSLSSEKEKQLINKIEENFTNSEKNLVKVSLKRPYLADEVSKKVKDSLIGLLASYRNGNEELKPYNQSLFIENKPILLILFLERSELLNYSEQFKPLANSLKVAIEQKTKFLGKISVSVINTLTVPPNLGVKVTSDTDTVKK